MGVLQYLIPGFAAQRVADYSLTTSSLSYLHRRVLTVKELQNTAAAKYSPILYNSYQSHFSIAVASKKHHSECVNILLELSDYTNGTAYIYVGFICMLSCGSAN